MLKSTAEFDTDTRFNFILARPFWDAVCPETGAILSRGYGRVKSGNAPKYTLILPNKSLEERGGIFGDIHFNDNERKQFRAWSLSEAIRIGNEKLEKMLEKRKGEEGYNGQFDSPS